MRQLLLLFQILRRRNTESSLKGSRKIRRIIVGTEHSNFCDVHLGMVVQQMAGTAHADGLDKRLGCLVSKCRQSLTELEEAKPQTFGHMVGIYLTRQNQFVDDVDGLRQELVIGSIQFLTLVMIVGSKNIVVLFVQNVILLAQFLDALRKFGIDANLFLVAIAQE